MILENNMFVRTLQLAFLLVNIKLIFAAEETKKQPTAAAAASNPQKTAAKEIVLENVKFAVFNQDAGQPTDADVHSLKPGQKLPSKLAVDPQKKLQLTFVVKDKKTAEPITLHQAFILLVHEESAREIIYVAEPDKISKLYTFDLSMKTSEKDFSGVGGIYSIQLILGDFAVSNPFRWHFADLDLNIPSVPPPPGLPKSAQINYNVLPEIKHTFRSADPRPPTIVSDTFSAVCAAPLLLLFIMWLRVGLNFGNIKFSIWALGFHAGLCAIFGLYACYWLKLTMFETLKWLAVLAVPTLICGNRLLHSFSSGGIAKKQKPE